MLLFPCLFLSLVVLWFSQGLFFHEGYLYESTGLYGESTLRKVDISTGKVMKQVDLEPSLFGTWHVWQSCWRLRAGVSAVADVCSSQVRGSPSWTTTTLSC